MTARPLYKTDELARLSERVVRLENQLAAEREWRKQAQLNASRFHALMMQARIALIERKP